MNNLTLMKLIAGDMPSEKDIIDELYDICDREHSSCNGDCPVYRLNGNRVPDSAHDFEVNRGCDCFKNGRAMRDFIAERITEK